MSVSPFGLFWSCDPVFGSGGKSSSGDDYEFEHQQPEIHVTKLPLGSVMVNAELGMNSGIQFQRFDHYAVGVQSVAEMGVLDVVDVWGQGHPEFRSLLPAGRQSRLPGRSDIASYCCGRH